MGRAACNEGTSIFLRCTTVKELVSRATPRHTGICMFDIDNVSQEAFATCVVLSRYGLICYNLASIQRVYLFTFFMYGRTTKYTLGTCMIARILVEFTFALVHY